MNLALISNDWQDLPPESRLNVKPDIKNKLRQNTPQHLAKSNEQLSFESESFNSNSHHDLSVDSHHHHHHSHYNKGTPHQ